MKRKRRQMLVSPILLVVLIGFIHHATGELKPVDIPALGRPFSLGDLYDRRRDVIVQGPKLWSHTELDNFSESKTYSTRFEIVTSESIDEDMKHLDLSASIKMSFLAGLIKVSGSASYLDDRKKKNNQARVSLKYKSTTFKRVLKPRVFTKVTYPDVLKKATDATDVVVAIQYGAGAIFTFDRSVKMSEHKRDIQGNLEVAVKKIPTFEVNGQGKVEIGEAEKKNTESFTCKFHGDFVLRNHPGTYQEAIKVYKELPELLGMNYENSVPVKVWLYPLEKLPLERTAQIVYDVKESLVVSVTDQIEDLQNIIRQCNDILDTQVATHHGRIRIKVDDFKSYVERYVLLYRQKLISILPAIRKGESSMSELTRLVTDKERSPFAQRNLQLWISRFNEEVAVLSRIQSLPNYCRDSGDFSAKLLNGKKYTLGLTLKIGSYEDKYLDAIREFLITEQNTRLPNQHVAKWWRPGSMTLYNLQVMSSTFKQFHEIKEKESQTSLSSPNVQFLVREEIIYDGEKEDIQIELYNGAYLSQRSYQLTSAPGRPSSTAKSHASITIRWVKPEKGYNNLRSFVIRCYTLRTNNMSEGCEGNYCKVAERVVSKSKLSYTMSGLQTQTPYLFTVTSKTDLGETATSISSDQISTTKCSPGHYEMGERQCKKCAKGTYSKYYGQKSCNPCPSGTFGSVEGLKAVSECQQCPKGTYNTKPGQQAASICVRCPAGTFNDKTGSTAVSACKKCPKGSYNGHTGQQSAVSCSKCKVNFYNDREGVAQCKACPSGMKTKAIGAVYVSECHSVQGSAQVGAQLKTMKDQVSNEIEKFEDEVEESEKQIADAMKKLNAEKSGIAKIVTQHVQYLQREFANIFDCTWGLGDGMYGSNTKYDSYVGVVKNREHCVYKCLQMKAYKDTTINGATHGTKDNKCWCEKKMNARDSKSNYYSCIFKFN